MIWNILIHVYNYVYTCIIVTVYCICNVHVHVIIYFAIRWLSDLRTGHISCPEGTMSFIRCKRKLGRSSRTVR